MSCGGKSCWTMSPPAQGFLPLLIVLTLWIPESNAAIRSEGSLNGGQSLYPTSSNDSFLKSESKKATSLPWVPAAVKGLFARTEGKKASWKTEIEKLFEVRCSPGSIEVLLHYNARYSRYTANFVDAIREKGELRVDDAEGVECVGEVDEEEGAIRLTAPHSSCGTETTFTNHTLIYSLKIAFRVEEGEEGVAVNLLSGLSFSYPVSCTHPLDEGTGLSQSAELYKDKAGRIPLGPEVFLGGLFYLHSFASSTIAPAQLMRGYPVNCWIVPSVPANSIKGETQGIQFVENGCPATDRKGRGLARIYHLKGARTVVSLYAGTYLLPSPPPLSIRVQCQLIPCVNSYTQGFLNIPKCPKPYCAGDPKDSHSLPKYLKGVTLSNATSKASRVLKEQKEPDIRMKPGCAKSCGTSSPTESETGEAPSVVHGISTPVAAGIAFLSFLLGVALMGAIWFVQIATDPARKLKQAQESNSEGDGAFRWGRPKSSRTPAQDPGPTLQGPALTLPLTQSQRQEPLPRLLNPI